MISINNVLIMNFARYRNYPNLIRIHSQRLLTEEESKSLKAIDDNYSNSQCALFIAPPICI